MKDGFVKVAAATPKIKVADVDYNGEKIKKYMKEASREGAVITVFPELCLTSRSCGDMFLQRTLLDAARNKLDEIKDFSKDLGGIFFIGLPIENGGKIYNAVAAVGKGEIYGFVPKTFLTPGEERYFSAGGDADCVVESDGGEFIPLCPDIIFRCCEMPEISIGCEVGSDITAVFNPGAFHAGAGANIIVNPYAAPEAAGRKIKRDEKAKALSAQLICGYILAGAGEGESTASCVYPGHNIIAENGSILNESPCFSTGVTYSEIDVFSLNYQRSRNPVFRQSAEADGYIIAGFNIETGETHLTRVIDPLPFVPDDDSLREERCSEIFSIQAYGLKKRFEHTKSEKAVLGISGGLDSTLSLLVTARAFDLMGKSRKDICAVTMPGFGTTGRTYENAVKLIKSLGAEFREINISEAVLQHFKDINQDPEKKDAAYENAQARERTQILMDISNQVNGLAVGTGDMSELALGWATYNGDHMSMYNVNGSVPKTLVRYLVKYYADTCGDEGLKATLYDVLDTPVSPELLPANEGEIAQKTEDIVGPYELHDFFLYNMIHYGASPSKIYRLANAAFVGTYDGETLLKWEKTFYRRFFSQQFKRSCSPDGPAVGSVNLSPGGVTMPSDVCSKIWLDELEKL